MVLGSIPKALQNDALPLMTTNRSSSTSNGAWDEVIKASARLAAASGRRGVISSMAKVFGDRDRRGTAIGSAETPGV
jgi:hypothetical protein